MKKYTNNINLLIVILSLITFSTICFFILYYPITGNTINYDFKITQQELPRNSYYSTLTPAYRFKGQYRFNKYTLVIKQVSAKSIYFVLTYIDSNDVIYSGYCEEINDNYASNSDFNLSSNNDEIAIEAKNDDYKFLNGRYTKR